MKKFKIGICDDEKIIAHLLKDIVMACLDKKEMNGDLKIFESGEELIKSVTELDAVFLDIEMPGLNGLETANMIKDKNRNCKIIIATSSDKHYKEAIIIDVFRYVTKPFALSEIEEALGALKALEFEEEKSVGTNKIEIYENRNPVEVEQRVIQYMVTVDSYVEFIIKNRILRKNLSLNELENILDQRIFFRIHRNCIVNMLSIESYKNGVITINNEEIQVSRRKKKEFEQAYMECDINYR